MKICEISEAIDNRFDARGRQDDPRDPNTQDMFHGNVFNDIKDHLQVFHNKKPVDNVENLFSHRYISVAPRYDRGDDEKPAGVGQFKYHETNLIDNKVTSNVIIATGKKPVLAIIKSGGKILLLVNNIRQELTWMQVDREMIVTTIKTKLVLTVDYKITGYVNMYYRERIPEFFPVYGMPPKEIPFKRPEGNEHGILVRLKSSQIDQAIKKPHKLAKYLKQHIKKTAADSRDFHFAMEGH